MQFNHRGLITTILLTTLTLSPLAEAKRIGGGRSYGMSRSYTSGQSYKPTHSYSPNYSAPQSASTQRSGSGLGKMVAAGVAGAAIGAVAANAMADHNTTATPATTQDPTTATQPQEQKSSHSWLWIAILGILGFFLYRRFSGQKVKAANPYAPNSNAPFGQTVTPRNVTPTPSNDNTNIFDQTVGTAAATGAAYTNSGNQLPDGTEPAAFLRQARAKFLHLQSMNSNSNIDEIARYFTPEMFQAIRGEILSNADLAEFPQLNAQLADSSTENGQYVASVRFSGMVSEELNAQPVPFAETWHFIKAISGGDWLVAGIQQG